MKALQIVNNSKNLVIANYFTPNEWAVSLASQISVHVFYVKFDKGGNYTTSFAKNFAENHLAITKPISGLITFDIVEVDVCNDTQIPFPKSNHDDIDTSLESYVNSEKKQSFSHKDSDYKGFAYDQYEGINSL
jgi:hypothetical protein